MVSREGSLSFPRNSAGYIIDHAEHIIPTERELSREVVNANAGSQHRGLPWDSNTSTMMLKYFLCYG